MEKAILIVTDMQSKKTKVILAKDIQKLIDGLKIDQTLVVRRQELVTDE